MPKVTGLFDQSLNLPPAWVPLIEKILRWYDNQQYPILCPFLPQKPREQAKKVVENSFLSTIKLYWEALTPDEMEAWNTAADFVRRSGYQLFVKDMSYRMKNGLSLPGVPSEAHQTHGLMICNFGGGEEVRLQRDDVVLTGPIEISFYYKKVEYDIPFDKSFWVKAEAWYMEGGENKSEVIEWESPLGNVDWTQVEKTLGVAGRVYFHLRIIFYLDYYDADVYLADILIRDQTTSWLVEYNGDTLPEDAVPPWTKTGDLEKIKVVGKRLHLEDTKESGNWVKWLRTPTFINEVGSSVKIRLKVNKGTHKDLGVGEYSAFLKHGDGTYEVEVYFYANGIRFVVNGANYPYHYDTSKITNYRTTIKGDIARFYIGAKVIFRKSLSGSGSQEVSFGAYSRDSEDLDVWVSYLRYCHGGSTVEGEDVLREGFWFKAGKEWEVENLYRKTGYYFLPAYREPYFQVVFLD